MFGIGDLMSMIFSVNNSDDSMEIDNFSKDYRCYPVVMLPGNEREDVEKGGKIILPASTLAQLLQLNIGNPMQFKITNKKDKRLMTHVSVLEFIGDEGRSYIPLWMMRNLLLDEGDLVTIETVQLPKATYCKLQPQSKDFLDISDQKAALENFLRNFGCLTTGDLLVMKYNGKLYELRVMETKPENAVGIIDCDMNTDFDIPEEWLEKPDQMAEAEPVGDTFYTFKGTGNRLNGKPIEESDKVAPPAREIVRGTPDFDHDIYELKFDRRIYSQK